MAASIDSGAVASSDSAELASAASGDSPTVPTDRLLHDWRRAHRRCVLYQSRLGIPEDEFMKLGAVSRDNPSCP